jgi:hypothetical protein
MKDTLRLVLFTTLGYLIFRYLGENKEVFIYALLALSLLYIKIVAVEKDFLEIKSTYAMDGIIGVLDRHGLWDKEAQQSIDDSVDEAMKKHKDSHVLYYLIFVKPFTK